MKFFKTLTATRRLNSKKPEKICKAAEWLGKIQHANSVFPLASALKHEDPSVRRAAAAALGEIGDDQAVVPLVIALEEKDEDAGQAVKVAITSFGNAVVPQLIAASKSDNDRLREGAAAALGLLNDQSGVESLISSLTDASADVRAAAARALGDITDERAIVPLLLILQDDYEKCRMAGQDAMVSYGSLASSHLLQALKHENSKVRVCAIRALGAIKEYSAIVALSNLLEGDSEELKRESMVALGHIEEAIAIPHLRKHLDDDDRDFRNRAFEALEALANKAVAGGDWETVNECASASIRPIVEDVFNRLTEVKEQKNPEWNSLDWVPQSLETLVSIGDIKALPFMLKLTKEPALSECSLKAIEDWLIKAPGDFTDEQIRQLAALDDVVAMDLRDPAGPRSKRCETSAANKLARQELRSRADPTFVKDSPGKETPSQDVAEPQETPAEPALSLKSPRVRIHDDVHASLPDDGLACSVCTRPVFSAEDRNVRFFVSENRLDDSVFVRKVRKTFWMMEQFVCSECEKVFCWECAVKHLHESGVPSAGENLEWCPSCAAKICVAGIHRERSQVVLTPKQVARTVSILLEIYEADKESHLLAFDVGNRLSTIGWKGVDAYFGRLYAAQAAGMLAAGRITLEQLKATLEETEK